MDLASVVQDHLRFFCIDRDHGSAKYLADIVFLIPALRLHGNLLCSQGSQHGFRQHRTIVGGAGLVGDHDNGSRLIPFPDGLGRVQAGDTVSKDNVVFLRVVGEGILLYVSRNEVLLADAAYRADLQGRIKDFAADETFHQSSGACFFRLAGFDIQYAAAKLVAILVGAHQIGTAWLKAYPESLVHLHAELF